MKNYILTTFIIGLCIFNSQCQKNELSLSKVGKYIQSIENSSYKVDTIPNFSLLDLAEFMKVELNFHDRFLNYFGSPISSIVLREEERPSSGEFIMCTIERIRRYEGSYETYIFASLVPKIYKKDFNENEKWYLTPEELEIAWQLYKDWWSKSEELSWTDLRQINPLEGTNYYWR